MMINNNIFNKIQYYNTISNCYSWLSASKQIIKSLHLIFKLLVNQNWFLIVRLIHFTMYVHKIMYVFYLFIKKLQIVLNNCSVCSGVQSYFLYRSNTLVSTHLIKKIRFWDFCYLLDWNILILFHVAIYNILLCIFCPYGATWISLPSTIDRM